LAAPGGEQAKNRAVVAVTRKLAVLLRRIWTTQEPYLPFYAEARDEALCSPVATVTAWASSSIFLGGLKVQRHTLSRWFANVEIKVCLFVAFGVLLSPQVQQKRRKLRKDNLLPVDLRVTSRAESDHQLQQRLARFPMMDSGIGITAHPTGVPSPR
jgi:hypothetical protein